MTGPAVSRWPTFVVAGLLSVILAFLVLWLSGALLQLGDRFGRGVLVLTLFLFVPGAASAGWGVHLYLRGPVQGSNQTGSGSE